MDPVLTVKMFNVSWEHTKRRERSVSHCVQNFSTTQLHWEKKSPLLQVSKKIPELTKNLKQFLGGEPESDSEAAEDDADLEVEDTFSYASSNKRRQIETLTESDASYAASQNSEEEEVEEPDLSSMSDISGLILHLQGGESWHTGCCGFWTRLICGWGGAEAGQRSCCSKLHERMLC